MSKALFITNIGNSDLGKDDKPLWKLFNEYNKYFKNINKEELEKLGIIDNKGNFNIYKFTKYIYDNNLNNELDLRPIIIDEKIEKLTDAYGELDVILIVTEQKPNPHSKDTLYMGKIIKEYLENKYSKLKDRIEIITITEEPQDHLKMFKEYNVLISNLSNDDDKEYKEDSKNCRDIYIGITGGTPAQISSLLINGVEIWGGSLTALYKPQGKSFIETKISDLLFKRLKSKEYNAYLNKGMYLLAAEHGKKYGLIDDSKYYELLGMHHKYLFDFNKSLEYYKKSSWENSSLDNKGKINEEIKKLENFINYDPNDLEDYGTRKELIKLLIESTIIKWNNGEYVDVVGRLFRLEEELLKYIVEKEFKKSMNMYKKDGVKDFYGYWELLSEEEGLKEYLSNLEGPNGNIKVDAGVNRITLNGIVNYLINVKKLKKYNPILNLSDKLSKLSELRNSSIIAHGFSGVSKYEIIEKYNYNKNIEDELINDLNTIIKIINMDII